MNGAEQHRATQDQAGRGVADHLEVAAAIQRELYDGMGHHQAGRMDKAADIYRAILQRQPDHADANNLLGVIAFQAGDHDGAVALISKAIALNPAIASYHCNLGIPLKALDRLDEARAAYERAIILNPAYGDAHFNLGNLHQKEGRHRDAVAAYDAALVLQPDHAESHLNRGLSLRKTGRLGDAVAGFRMALVCRPAYGGAHHNLGLALREAGETDKAIACLRHAVALDPENDAIWGDLSEAIGNVAFTTIDDDLYPTLLTMLERPVVRPHAVSRAVLSALAHEPDMAALLEGGRAMDGAEAVAAAGRLSQIPLLLRLMALCVLNDIATETMLTGLRRALILGPDITQGLPFVAALALQCFANEYAYLESDEESAAVEALAERLAAQARNDQDIAPAQLAILAAYRPLYELAWFEPLEEKAWPDDIRQVIARQWREPHEELRLRADIPCLTPIEDEVSRGVREQYEENPYPRWLHTGLPARPLSIGEHLEGAVLNRPLEDYISPEAPDILVAGCGTGQHGLLTAARYRNSRVLAVDLSRASLSYALRKTRELGIDNIDYRQGDILELAHMDRRFDLIECAGVLHHMDDPLAGWRVLADLLRPGGLMFIGLYSEAARRSVAAAREMIAAKGYAPSAEGIRRCRKDIVTAVGGGDREMEKLVIWSDFYSLSGCRDLLFHVREHRFTIPMIEDACAQLGLTFIAFGPSGNMPAVRKFKQLHGAVDGPASLDLWRRFEDDNPDSFAGMYQFWLRKA